ncbi:hypothetical protein H9Q70_005279 [Fusarium xylarioides]|nr:hypothetical protein H9Q70_005279 [Fusarium xylarioides]KAG5780460.1 hypothetical protein H9Q73_005902 [Fusarium xylarioides]
MGPDAAHEIGLKALLPIIMSAEGVALCHSLEAILEKLLSLEVADVRHLSQMPDFRSLCKRLMRLMWRSPKEGETEYCPWVGNRTMEAAQQHIIAWATSALKSVHACQHMRYIFEDRVDSN